MSRKISSLKEALISSGLNASYQRVKILEHFMERRDHPTVSMAYDALIHEVPTIAKATVYNTLNALEEKRLLTALTIKPEEACYDYKREPYHHFLCKRCGSILDKEIRCTYADVSEVEGHRVEDIHGYFKGTCNHCLRQERHPGRAQRNRLNIMFSKKEDENG